jgi:hypothetical protein
MTNTKKRLPFKVEHSPASEAITHVELWYDRKSRNWIAQAKNADDFQQGNAEVWYTKEQTLECARLMWPGVKIVHTDPTGERVLHTYAAAATARVGADAYDRETGKRWCVTAVAPGFVTLTSYASGAQCTVAPADFGRDFNGSAVEADEPSDEVPEWKRERAQCG